MKKYITYNGSLAKHFFAFAEVWTKDNALILIQCEVLITIVS